MKNPQSATKVEDIQPLILVATVDALKTAFPNLGVTLLLSDSEKCVSASSLPPEVTAKLIRELSERLGLITEEVPPAFKHH